MGYPEGREPRYYWSREQLGDGTLVGVEAVTPLGAVGFTSLEAVLLSREPAGLLLQF